MGFSSVFDDMFQQRKDNVLKVSEEWYVSSTLPISYIPISDLSPMARSREHKTHQVMVSLMNKGFLYNPLVVFRLTSNDWKLIKSSLHPSMDSPPSEGWHNMVMCGCNRYEAAKRLGYGEVACVIVGSWEAGVEVCKRTEKDKRWKTDGVVLPKPKQ
jgi:hypothetical protein